MPTQLKLGFTSHVAPFRLALTLDGLVVTGEVFEIPPAVAATHLAAEGLQASVYGDRVRFPVTQLKAATELSDRVLVTVDDKLSALWHILAHPPEENTPVELTLDPPSTLVLSWTNRATNYFEDLHPQAAAALLNLEIPFVARADAFEFLRHSCNLPIVAGKALMNPDGFVEIASNKPQLASAAPIRAMFRVSSTVFGVPAAYASDIDAAPGIVWSQRPPASAPLSLRTLPTPVSDTVQKNIREFAKATELTRAHALAWPSGSGRRFFALAAAYSLGKLPVLVVTHPAFLWLWQRHAQLVGLPSGAGESFDVRVMTYEQVRNKVPARAQCVIFDDLARALRQQVDILDAVRHLPSPVLRVSVDTSWPESVRERNQILQAIRPEEFDVAIPVDSRYVPPALEKFDEHQRCFVSLKDTDDVPAHSFKDSDVVTVEPQQPLADKMAQVRSSTAAPASKLTSLMELTSRGSADDTSPKIAVALDLVAKAVAAGESVAVCTRFESAAMMMSMLGNGVETVDARGLAQIPHHPRAVVVLFDTDLPYLTMYDNVVFIDYPWSTASLDQCVGSAGLASGAKRVTVVHMEGSVDDKLAVLAAQRRDERLVSAHAHPPNPRQMELLVS